MGVAANEPKAETPFAAGPVILNVQSSLRRATLSDESVEFGAWRVFARLALGYGHDPNGAGAADPDGRGPFPTAASEATTSKAIPRLLPNRVLTSDLVRLRRDRGRRVVSDSRAPVDSTPSKREKRSNTCQTPNILDDGFCLRHHGHNPAATMPPPACRPLTSASISPRQHPKKRIDPNHMTCTGKPIRPKIRATITTGASAGRTDPGQARPPVHWLVRDWWPSLRLFASHQAPLAIMVDEPHRAFKSSPLPRFLRCAYLRGYARWRHVNRDA